MANNSRGFRGHLCLSDEFSHAIPPRKAQDPLSPASSSLYDIQHLVFDGIDRGTSTDDRLACKNVYENHWKRHGGVDLWDVLSRQLHLGDLLEKGYWAKGWVYDIIYSGKIVPAVVIESIKTDLEEFDTVTGKVV